MAGSELEKKDGDQEDKTAGPKLAVVDESQEADGFAIVGVGASAGGLEAFSQLLKALPKEPGLAIVFVQHVAPHHESALATLLGGATDLPVLQPVEDTPLEANHVYVIPPNRSLVLKDHRLLVQPRHTDHTQYTPVDTFFQSLAEAQGPDAIGVILSGTARDGVEGVHAIKAAGGTMLVQDPQTAKQEGMPRAAIATGRIDLVLPPTELAEELVRLGRVSQARGPQLARSDSEQLGPEHLGKIFALLRHTSGVDFSQYKLPTIERRIGRRMVMNKATSIDEYLRRLTDDPQEVQLLYRDILIHATSFFREPESFQALAKDIFPTLLKDRSQEAPIRIWAPACSTGEEPYSIAMTLVECLDARPESVPIQIFATDISETAIEQARAGVYPPAVVEELLPARGERFFTKVDGQYRINKTIRDLCVFARQDLTRDPPFSKLDLIVCRNVLIYLSQPIQSRLMSVFHYALKATGYLMLGNAETIGRHSELFAVSDRKHCIYRKKHIDVPAAVHFAAPYRRQAGRGVAAEEARGPGALQSEANRVILDRYSPPGVIVNEEMRIIQFLGQTGRFLEPAPGDASLNLLKMCREGLLHGLRAALQAAKKKDQPVRREALRVKTNGDSVDVSVEVVPLTVSAEGRHFLVMFQDITRVAPARIAPTAKIRTKGGARQTKKEEVDRLEKELVASRGYLQSIIQDLEAANEELQSANEEILSSNEELQSTNEELDTAKEELQSANEELNTVNEELHGRNEELARINGDLINLLNSVQIAIVIVASDLKIRRFTPTAEKILNLIPGDIGRPISQIKPNIHCPDLEKLLREVIDTIEVQQREVQDVQGRTYSLHIRPYKSVDNRIDGAVLALFDIDEVRRHQRQAQEAQEYAEAVFNTVSQPLIVLDGELRVERVNLAFFKMFQIRVGDVERRLIYEAAGGRWNIPDLRRLLEVVLPTDNRFENFEIEQPMPDGGKKRLRFSGRRIMGSDKRPALILLAVEEMR